MLKTMMVITVIGLLAVLIAGAFVLVVMNRASEKVVSASVPIAVAALAGIALVFVFAEEPTVSRTFPVKFIRFKDSAAPAGISFRREHDVVFLAATLLAGKAGIGKVAPYGREYPTGTTPSMEDRLEHFMRALP